jgi:cytochrome c5
MRGAVLGLLAFISGAYASSDFDREQIQQRISPVGQVRLKEATVEPVSTVTVPQKTEEPVKKNPGQVIYEQYCMVCHRDGVAGAPKFRNAEEWGLRSSKKNIEALTASAIKGLNAMPAKGTCQDCSDADIKAAIQYMVPQ